MFFNCFYAFLYIIESVIANVYFLDNFEKRFKSIITYILGLLVYSICFVINITTDNNVLINLMAFFFINILFAKFLYKISYKNALLHSSILLAIMFSSEMVVESIMVYFLNVNFDEYESNDTFLVIFGLVSKMLYLIICKTISYSFSFKNVPQVKIKSTLLLFIYPVMNTIMLMMFMYSSIHYDFSMELNVVFMVVSILSLIFCCSFFILNQKIQVKENEFIKLQSEKQKAEQDRTFYTLLEKKNEEQRILAHDINHHFSALMAMDNAESMKKYLVEVKPELDEYKFIGKTQNKMLDLILNKYSHICQMNDINFIVDIRTSNLSFMEDVDLSSMLGNLLDNAVEAAKGTDNAFIRFVAKREKSFNIVSAVNSSSHSPKARGETLMTTKENSSFHGYGIKSIERTAEKYDGMCQWYYDEENKEFHYNILFNTIKK